MIDAIRSIARARPLGALAALLLCTTLAACGGDGDSGNASTPPGAIPPAAATPDPVKPSMKCAP